MRLPRGSLTLRNTMNHRTLLGVVLPLTAALALACSESQRQSLTPTGPSTGSGSAVSSSSTTGGQTGGGLGGAPGTGGFNAGGAGGQLLATSSVSGAGGMATGVALGWLVTDFSALDVNPNSPRYNQAVSPKDYATQVSGWYFGHST